MISYNDYGFYQFKFTTLQPTYRQEGALKTLAETPVKVVGSR